MVVRERALELRALLCLDGIAVDVAEDLGGELERGSDGGGATGGGAAGGAGRARPSGVF